VHLRKFSDSSLAVCDNHGFLQYLEAEALQNADFSQFFPGFKALRTLFLCIHVMFFVSKSLPWHEFWKRFAVG
jgi:hypothetical protein